MSNPSLVLVVEDDADIRDALTQILEDEGYEVYGAANGQMGLDWLKAHHPAVILLDLMMQGINGWQFITILRQSREIAHLPVILVSADRSVASEAKMLGANDFIAKPFDVDNLLAKVAHYTQTAECVPGI